MKKLVSGIFFLFLTSLFYAQCDGIDATIEEGFKRYQSQETQLNDIATVTLVADRGYVAAQFDLLLPAVSANDAIRYQSISPQNALIIEYDDESETEFLALQGSPVHDLVNMGNEIDLGISFDKVVYIINDAESYNNLSKRTDTMHIKFSNGSIHLSDVDSRLLADFKKCLDTMDFEFRPMIEK